MDQLATDDEDNDVLVKSTDATDGVSTDAKGSLSLKADLASRLRSETTQGNVEVTDVQETASIERAEPRIEILDFRKPGISSWLQKSTVADGILARSTGTRSSEPPR